MRRRAASRPSRAVDRQGGDRVHADRERPRSGDGTSTAFNITAGSAGTLVFTVQPTSTVAGASITPAVEVTARDANGNTATGFTAA